MDEKVSRPKEFDCHPNGTYIPWSISRFKVDTEDRAEWGISYELLIDPNAVAFRYDVGIRFVPKAYEQAYKYT